MRLHAENPDLTYDEVMELMLRTGRRAFRENEPRYKYNCRSCGDEVWLDQTSHDRYEQNKATGFGFTIPKCGDCWL